VRGVEEALHVQVYHAVPFLDRSVFGGSEQHHAGVVEERVEPAEAGHGLLDCPRCLNPDGHVLLYSEGPAARALDLFY
jgi:hypothetical protein